MNDESTTKSNLTFQQQDFLYSTINKRIKHFYTQVFLYIWKENKKNKKKPDNHPNNLINICYIVVNSHSKSPLHHEAKTFHHSDIYLHKCCQGSDPISGKFPIKLCSFSGCRSFLKHLGANGVTFYVIICGHFLEYMRYGSWAIVNTSGLSSWLYIRHLRINSCNKKQYFLKPGRVQMKTRLSLRT